MVDLVWQEDLDGAYVAFDGRQSVGKITPSERGWDWSVGDAGGSEARRKAAQFALSEAYADQIIS